MKLKKYPWIEWEKTSLRIGEIEHKEFAHYSVSARNYTHVKGDDKPITKINKGFLSRFLDYIGPKLFYDWYDWAALTKSLKIGYRPEKYEYISVYEVKNKDGTKNYKTWDGNHRIKVLRELYGDDYIIDVLITDIYNTRKKHKL